jgi:hypothetical protein
MKPHSLLLRWCGGEPRRDTWREREGARWLGLLPFLSGVEGSPARFKGHRVRFRKQRICSQRPGYVSLMTTSMSSISVMA